ncbi:MAG: hypothetical protein J7L95_01095 [Prolixibacteraceae bacterium]|nr:hypothetical protein [Prolixibacteraceae bacterium]
MKRRTFIRITGATSAFTALMPAMGFKGFSEKDISDNYQSFILQDFKDEQEESPSMVADGNGNLWIFTLRRLKYPHDKELISAFRLNGDKWEEINPVTKKTGHYEAPVSACAFEGKPVVAWCEINSGKWQF